MQYVRDELPAARGEQASALLTGSRGDVSFAVALEFRLPSLPQQLHMEPLEEKGNQKSCMRTLRPPTIGMRCRRRRKRNRRRHRRFGKQRSLSFLYYGQFSQLAQQKSLKRACANTWRCFLSLCGHHCRMH